MAENRRRIRHGHRVAHGAAIPRRRFRLRANQAEEQGKRKIAKGKPRTVLVEVGLGETPSASGQDGFENILKVTLRQPGGAGETATLGRKAANCASGFYSQIVKVREGSDAGIAGAIKAARSKNRSQPGRWLFPPRFKTAKASRKCISRAKRWNKRRGRTS